MSELRIALVAEGKTDLIVIESALKAILGARCFTMTLLQPELSNAFATDSQLGAGWGGVYRWCRAICQRPPGLAVQPLLSTFHCVILHLDADVAEKRYEEAGITNPPRTDLPCSHPCPPSRATVDALIDVLRGWLEVGLNEEFSENWLLCIPSKNTETWVVAALVGIDRENNPRSDIGECHHLEHGRAKKNPRAYLEHAPEITRRWPRVVQTCSPAKVFTESVHHMFPENQTC